MLFFFFPGPTGYSGLILVSMRASQLLVYYLHQSNNGTANLDDVCVACSTLSGPQLTRL